MEEKEALLDKENLQPMSQPVAAFVLNAVEHSSFDLESLVDDLDYQLGRTFVVGESVIHENNVYEIKLKERYGKVVQYTLSESGKSETTKVDGRELKRGKGISREDIRDFIRSMARLDGKIWKVKDDVREKFSIKKKLAPIFLNAGHSKKTQKKPNEAIKEMKPKEVKVVIDANYDTEVWDPLIAESLVAKKLTTKKAPKPPSEPKQKAKTSAPKGNLTNFLVAKGDNGHGQQENGSSIFISAQKRSEERLKSINAKIEQAWDLGDHEMFTIAIAHAAKNLVKNEISKIKNDVWACAIEKVVARREYIIERKKISTDEQREKYRLKRTAEIAERYRQCTIDIRSHFKEKKSDEKEKRDDDFSHLENLEIVGDFVSSDEKLIQCLTLTQMMHAMREFSHYGENISSRELLDSLEKGREGFLSCSWRVYETLLRTLLNTAEYEKYAHFNARMRELPLDAKTVSEICRAFFIGSKVTNWEDTRHAKSEDKKINPVEENDPIVEKIENSSGDRDILAFFTDDKNVWELTQTQQLEILGKLIECVLTTTSYKDYLLSGVVDTAETNGVLGKRNSKEKLERLRGSPIGKDRHYRFYYWLTGSSEDTGIWIQNVEPVGKEEHNISDNDEYDTEEAHDIEKSSEKSVEGWWRVNNPMQLEMLISSLSVAVPRENSLKKYLTSNTKTILESMNPPLMEVLAKESDKAQEEENDTHQRNALTPEPSDVGIALNAMTSLKNDMAAFGKDLKESILADDKSVDLVVEQLTGCDDVDGLKVLLVSLSKTIYPNAIIQSHGTKIARINNTWSHLILDRWIRRLKEVANVSAVHLLLSFLSSRVKWRKKILERRCAACFSTRHPEKKIVCLECELVCHYTCVRPRLEKKPEKWYCANCSSAIQRKKREEMRQEGGSDTERDDSDDDSDENWDNRAENTRITRKRIRDAEKKVEERNNRQIKKMKSRGSDKVRNFFEEVRDADSRLLRVLQDIPVRRGTRGSRSKNLEELEGYIDECESVDDFKKEFIDFLDVAKEYLSTHNPRKCNELDNLIVKFSLYK